MWRSICGPARGRDLRVACAVRVRPELGRRQAAGVAQLRERRCGDAVQRGRRAGDRAGDERGGPHRRRKREVRVMAIVVNLDVMLAKRKLRSKELAETIGITEANLSLLKSGKVRGVRFETLEKICAALDCQPGDLLEYRPEG